MKYMYAQIFDNISSGSDKGSEQLAASTTISDSALSIDSISIVIKSLFDIPFVILRAYTDISIIINIGTEHISKYNSGCIAFTSFSVIISPERNAANGIK